MLRKAEAARQRGRAGEEEGEVEGGGGGKQKKAGNLFPPKQRWGEEEEEEGVGGVGGGPNATSRPHAPNSSTKKVQRQRLEIRLSDH